MAEVRPALFCTLHAVSDAGPLRRLMGYHDDPKTKTQRALPPPRAAYIPTQTMRLVGSQLCFSFFFFLFSVRRCNSRVRFA